MERQERDLQVSLTLTSNYRYVRALSKQQQQQQVLLSVFTSKSPLQPSQHSLRLFPSHHPGFFTDIHSQNVHWHSLSKCSLAFTLKMFTGIHCHFPFCSRRTDLLKNRFPPSFSISPTYTFHQQHPPPTTSCLLLLYTKVPSALCYLSNTLHNYSCPAILHSFTDSETHPTRQPPIPCFSYYSTSSSCALQFT